MMPEIFFNSRQHLLKEDHFAGCIGATSSQIKLTAFLENRGSNGCNNLGKIFGPTHLIL